MGRGAIESYIEVQGRAQLTFDNDLSYKWFTFHLFLCFINKYVGALLARDVEGVEHLVYYSQQVALRS